MKILFLGKGISNDGASNLANILKIEYEYLELKEVKDYNYDLVVKGPGIYYHEPVIKKFINKNIIIITDVEFVYRLINRYFIGVTGSNGKTTTTLLVNEIVKTTYKSIACGNIGYSIAQATLDHKDCTHFICELSSFQLKGINTFAPNIAIITNINSCHLDYHKTQEDYIKSKANICINQTTNDLLIYNYDCKESREISKLSKAKLKSFSLTNKTCDAYSDGIFLYYNNEKIIKQSKIKQASKESIANYLVAIIVGFYLGIDKKKIVKQLVKFKNPDYRFSYIKKTIINDGKSTNVYSTMNALKSINDSTILICGGHDRDEDLTKLDDCIGNLKLVVCYGQTKRKCYQYFTKRNISCYMCGDLKTSVKIALDWKKRNDILLYSPMFASYDQYSSYVDRAKEFDKLILEK